MAIEYAAYSGKSNIGLERTVNEDNIMINEFDDEMLFAAIADGSGTQGEMFNPASIASTQVSKMLQRLYMKDKELFKANARMFIEEAFLSANNILIGFKLGDEKKRYGVATTLTCALIEKDGTLTFGHVGNTRLYLIRNGKDLLLTKDQTEGQKLVDANVISKEDYYTSIERLTLYNGLGISPEPFVQTYQLKKLQPNDIVVMTSDGIHYSYRSEAFYEILLKSDTVDEAAENMIKTALEQKNYPDNISVNVIWYLGEPGNE